MCNKNYHTIPSLYRKNLSHFPTALWYQQSTPIVNAVVFHSSYLTTPPPPPPPPSGLNLHRASVAPLHLLLKPPTVVASSVISSPKKNPERASALKPVPTKRKSARETHNLNSANSGNASRLAMRDNPAALHRPHLRMRSMRSMRSMRIASTRLGA